MNLTSEEADTLRALLVAVDLSGAWGCIEAAMREADIDDPEGVFQALRDKAFS